MVDNEIFRVIEFLLMIGFDGIFMNYYCNHFAKIEKCCEIMKIIYSEKAAKFDNISHLVLTLLNNAKNKKEISSNFCGLLRKPQL